VSWGNDIGRAVESMFIMLAVVAFLAGAVVMAGLMWLWPHLPSIRLVW